MLTNASGLGTCSGLPSLPAGHGGRCHLCVTWRVTVHPAQLLRSRGHPPGTKSAATSCLLCTLVQSSLKKFLPTQEE